MVFEQVDLDDDFTELLAALGVEDVITRCYERRLAVLNQKLTGPEHIASDPIVNKETYEEYLERAVTHIAQALSELRKAAKFAEPSKQDQLMKAHASLRHGLERLVENDL